MCIFSQRLSPRQAKLLIGGLIILLVLAAWVLLNIGRSSTYYLLLFMALGVVGEGFFKTERWAVLRPGERVEVGSYTLTYEGTNAQITPAKHRLQATLRVERNGRAWAVLRPEKNFHWNAEQWVTEVAIRPGLDEDFYLVLAGLGEDGRALFQILINPLMSWLWIGGALLLAGTLTALWPGPERDEGHTEDWRNRAEH